VAGDKEDPLSPPSQPSPLEGEGGSGLLTLSQKETSPEGEGSPSSPKETPRTVRWIKIYKKRGIESRGFFGGFLGKAGELSI